MNFPVLSTPLGKRQCPWLVRESTLLTFRVSDLMGSKVSFCCKRFWGPARTTGWVSTDWCCSLSTCLICCSCSPLNMRSQVHSCCPERIPESSVERRLFQGAAPAAACPCMSHPNCHPPSGARGHFQQARSRRDPREQAIRSVRCPWFPSTCCS